AASIAEPGLSQDEAPLRNCYAQTYPQDARARQREIWCPINPSICLPLAQAATRPEPGPGEHYGDNRTVLANGRARLRMRPAGCGQQRRVPELPGTRAARISEGAG